MTQQERARVERIVNELRQVVSDEDDQDVARPIIMAIHSLCRVCGVTMTGREHRDMMRAVATNRMTRGPRQPER